MLAQHVSVEQLPHISNRVPVAVTGIYICILSRPLLSHNRLPWWRLIE